MFKKLNESFHRMFLREAASDENTVENDVIKSLERNLREVALIKLSHGITNIKDYEYAFQDTIESFFPARAWWEVTDCNIFWTLFETKNTDDTIDEIIKGIKPEFRGEYKSEEIIEVRDDADVEAEKAINAREAEYGADGSRVFKPAIGDDVEIKESKALKEQARDFYANRFEDSIPRKMRYKYFDTVNRNDLYWVTQEFFNENDIEEFADAFKNTGFDKAYVTVRDLSGYDFEKDSEKDVFVIINKDGTYRVSDFLKKMLDKYNLKRNDSFKESKKLRKNKKVIEESFEPRVYDMCDAGTVTIYDGYRDPDADNGYYVEMNHPEKEYGQFEIECYDTKEEAENAARKAMELIKKSYDTGELSSFYDYNTSSVMKRIARKVRQEFPGIQGIFNESKKQRKNKKSLKEGAAEDSEVLNKTIKVYDLNTLIDKEVNDGSREEEYETFHFGDGAAIIVTSKGDGCVLDYEAVGQSFDATSDTVDIYLCPKSRDDGKGHKTFSIMPTAKVGFTVDELLKAPSKDVKVKDFFYKWNYNPRCQRNFEDIVHYLTESSKSCKRSESLRESSIPEDTINETDNVREIYMKYYPDDELGLRIEPSITFADVLQRMKNKEDFYDIINYGDSIIRERIFDLMSKIYDVDYDYFYYLWLGKDVDNNIFMESVSKNKRIDESPVKSVDGDRIKRLKNELADVLKSLKNGENPDRLNYRKDKIIDELQRLGCDDGWFECVNESIDEEEPYSYKQMYDDLKLNGVFDKEKGSFSVMFREEAEHCKKILKRAGYDFEVSGDDRVVPQWFHFEYWKKPLKEDTIKQGNSWVNKGKEGTHGKFRTKKEADAQRKAMFAQGYQEDLAEYWADNYSTGTVIVGNNRYYYEAKVFERPSQFGIDGGNISKLYVKRLDDGDGRVVAHYDRGWDIKPADTDTEKVVKIIEKRFSTAGDLVEGVSESAADKYYNRISEKEFAETLGFDSVEEFRENDYMDEAAESYDVRRVAFLKAKPEYFDELDNDGYAFVDLVSDGKKEFVGFYAGGRLYDIEDEIKDIIGE